MQDRPICSILSLSSILRPQFTTHHYGKERCDSFKWWGLSQYYLCCRDHVEHVADSFDNKIQPEYYCGNIYVSIKSITLDHFSDT